jgi:hypothetical protein
MNEVFHHRLTLQITCLFTFFLAQSLGNQGMLDISQQRLIFWGQLRLKQHGPKVTRVFLGEISEVR